MLSSDGHVRGNQRRIPKKVICPMCHHSAEIASLGFFLYAHHCPIGGWWYTNGILWSQNQKEVTPIERFPQSHREEDSGGDAGA